MPIENERILEGLRAAGHDDAAEVAERLLASEPEDSSEEKPKLLRERVADLEAQLAEARRAPTERAEAEQRQLGEAFLQRINSLPGRGSQ